MIASLRLLKPVIPPAPDDAGLVRVEVSPGGEDHFIYCGYGQGSGIPYADVRVLVRTDTTFADACRLLRGLLSCLEKVAAEENGE